MARTKQVEQICEVCLSRQAVSITHCRQDDKWYFCCSQCLNDGYAIEFDRLTEMNWLDHMSIKGWVDMGSFLPRFQWAYNQTKQ